MSLARRLRSERGSVAISGLFAALALIVLIGSGVDFAHAFIVRRELTAIADDAALAGSQRLDLQAWRQGQLALNPAEAEQAADVALAANPGISGSVQASASRVTVQARQQIATMMLRLVGIRDLTVTADASAQPKRP